MFTSSLHVIEPTPRRDPRVRAMPYPYKAWLCMSNDPDNTLYKDWQELHALIWEELSLPFGDTLFLRSLNQHLPEQVDLDRYPHILEAHPHDGLHTWGDYLFAGDRAFHRPDAEQAVAHLRTIGFRPRVWVDHSMFIGNMLHRNTLGGLPEFKDASGNVYPNQVYTLDLVREAGIRYLWNGTVTNVIGQDRQQGLWNEHVQRAGARTQGTINYMLHRFGGPLSLGQGFREQVVDNEAYHRLRFPDGSRFYVFPRYGDAPLADIDGLGELLSAEDMDELCLRGGTCIVYMHLGKRPPARMNDPRHVPPRTEAALRALAKRYRDRDIMLSSVSKLMDYLVLRDHLDIDEATHTIHFRSDGIAFDRVGAAELAGHSFSFEGLAPGNYSVLSSDGPLHTESSWVDGVLTLNFSS